MSGTWLVLAGLPGTGKSTVGEALARELGLPRLDKDRVREALFGPRHVLHDPRQDDHCMELVYAAARFSLESGLAPAVVIDGRTYGRAQTVRRLLAAAREAGARPVVLECRCPEDVARARLEHDDHPAADRGPELHARLAATACDLGPLLAGGEHRVVDTDRDLDALVEELLAWLRPLLQWAGAPVTIRPSPTPPAP